MQVSFTGRLEAGRATTEIGRVKATTRWRAADKPGSEDERHAAIEALKREAAAPTPLSMFGSKWTTSEGLTSLASRCSA